MKKQFAVAAAALSFALAGASALAQPKGPKGKAVQQVRYFDLSTSVFSELNSEVILKETRQGTALVAAELDICHTSPTSNRLDRVVVPLKVEGTRLLGSGQSQEEKQAVSVNLVRRVLAAGTFTFEGTISSGSYTEKVRSTDNAESTEDEITEQYLAETAIEPSPANFSAAWPQSLVVRVGRAGLIGLLDAARNNNVRIVFDGLITSCRVLRSGHFTVQIDVDPERVGAVLAGLKTVSAVTAMGFAANTPNMQRAIRFPSAGWRDAAGKLDRDKFAAAVGAAMAKAMSATVSSTSWDGTLGNLTIEMKRPDERVAGLKVTQLLTVTAIVAPESLSSSQRSLLWIESIAARIVEEREGARLGFLVGAADETDEGNEPDGSDDLPEAVAGALKGQTWDSEKEQWQQ